MAPGREFGGQPVIPHGKFIILFRPFQFMKQPLGASYGLLPNRLLIYLLWAACMLGGSFLLLGISGGAAYILRDVPSVCALALYVAALFTLSLLVADMAARYLWPRSMAYGCRSLGRQWMVLASGLALGLSAHQVIFPHMTQLCGLGPRSLPPIDPCLVPLWCAAFYDCLLAAPSAQDQAGSALAAAPAPSSAPSPALAGRGVTTFRVDGRRLNIPLKAISHVRLEDHYCRVYYQSPQGMRNILVRETLKGLIEQMGPDSLLQIHRSHLVNKSHVSAYRRQGRKHWLLLASGSEPLPVSRRRQAEVKEALAGMLPGLLPGPKS
ncbi:hypothetical protein AAU61_01385 [Desulfocarbo indianensis]|nr:hypothetical protein AAU61_01385 [Desulfocarbo indianensis]